MDRVGILVVEDEQSQRSLLAGLLKKEGYTVDEAEDGAMAYGLLQKGIFEIVLLDYRLPDTDGLTLLKKIKELNPSTEIVMITAFGSIENAVERSRPEPPNTLPNRSISTTSCSSFARSRKKHISSGKTRCCARPCAIASSRKNSYTRAKRCTRCRASSSGSQKPIQPVS